MLNLSKTDDKRGYVGTLSDEKTATPDMLLPFPNFNNLKLETFTLTTYGLILEATDPNSSRLFSVSKFHFSSLPFLCATILNSEEFTPKASEL